MLKDVPSCLTKAVQSSRTFDALEVAMLTNWESLITKPGECVGFLDSVLAAAKRQQEQQERGDTQPPMISDLNPEFVCLCATYCAAALVVSTGLDVFAGHRASSVETDGAAAASNADVRPTFAFLANPMSVAAAKQRVEKHPKTSAKLGTAAVLPAIVEDYFLTSRAAFRDCRKYLWQRTMALPLLGYVLRGYAAYMLTATANPTAASARCLRVLGRAVYADDTPYSGSGGGYGTALGTSSQPIAPAAAPGSQQHTQRTSRLSLAHATYLYVARAAHLPAAGLALLLDNPVLTLDPAFDGVSIVDYIRYYTEGATLLAELGRYADAAECVYNVCALNTKANFASLAETARAQLEGTDGSGGAARKKPRGTAVDDDMYLPNSFVRTMPAHASDFTPSSSEFMLAHELNEWARKLAIVLAIMGFGSAAAPSCVCAATARATYMQPGVLIPESYGGSLDPYCQLWKCASNGNLGGFVTVATSPAAGSSVFEKDGLLALVTQAMFRLRRFVVLRMASVYDTVTLQAVAAATSLSRIEQQRTSCDGGGGGFHLPWSGRHTTTLTPTSKTASTAQSRKMDVNERQEVLQLLTEMHEECQLLSYIALRAPAKAAARSTGGNGNEEEGKAEGEEKMWVVTWVLPQTLSAAGRCAYVAHRATYGNCTSISSNPSVSASLIGTGALPTPSATSSMIVAALRRADAMRAHIVAAEKAVDMWKKRLKVPAKYLEDAHYHSEGTRFSRDFMDDF